MEILLSIAFGLWFVIAAVFYGLSVKKGEEE